MTADSFKPEDQDVLLRIGFDTIKDLNAEIRHCDLVALLFITVNATICGSVVAGVLNVPFRSFFSTLGIFFLTVLFSLQVGVFRGLQTRVHLASTRITFIRANILKHYPALDMSHLRPFSEAKALRLKRLDMLYMYQAVFWYSAAIGAFAFCANVFILVSSPVSVSFFQWLSEVKY